MAGVSVLVPAYSLPARTPDELIALARKGLADADRVTVPSTRYANAHLAALRAASAVLAANARPAPVGRRRIASVWVVLTMCYPELSDWAAYFAAGAAKRSAIEAGVAPAVTTEEADQLAAEVSRFVGVVEELLELK